MLKCKKKKKNQSAESFSKRRLSLRWNEYHEAAYSSVLLQHNATYLVVFTLAIKRLTFSRRLYTAPFSIIRFLKLDGALP